MTEDDERAREEQAERWREAIEAAKAGQRQPPDSPREFTDPHRRPAEPTTEPDPSNDS
jgi:hypothetical protein